MDDTRRTLYDTFLDSGELEAILPEATGIWEKDKKEFKKIQDSLEGTFEEPSDSWEVKNIGKNETFETWSMVYTDFDGQF